MRLLLDECVPKRLKQELPDHVVRTVQDMGWAGIEYQQNPWGLTIGVVVLVATSNDIDDLRPLLPDVEQALAVALKPGGITLVGGHD